MAHEKITHEKIIAAVLQNAFLKSAEGTSLTDIANFMGIKKASLYNYFENRDAIFTAVCKFCGQFMASNPFIPPDYETSLKKYASPVVLKGVVRRYLKVYENELPLRIWTFITAEKYFLKDAFIVHCAEKEKISSQLQILFTAIKTAKSLDSDPAKEAFWFASAVQGYAEEYLLAHKINGDEVPPAGTYRALADMNAHIDWFCRVNGLD